MVDLTNKDLESFRRSGGNRLDAAKAILPLIRTGMSPEEVEALLAKPSATAWYFALFYSSGMMLWFDGNSQLVKIDSDIQVQLGSNAGPRRLAGSAMAIMSTEFKENPFNRRDVAERIITYLAPGLAADELTPLLGVANRTLWRYELQSQPRMVLDVLFNKNSLLQERNLQAL